MSLFHHRNIIELIGVCTHSSVWVVMELAALGELRQYLQREQHSINLSLQLLFSQELASAVAYLHSLKFVHCDIAARNVLVSSSRCVKLSDFGLSRLLGDDLIYTCRFF